MLKYDSDNSLTCVLNKCELEKKKKKKKKMNALSFNISEEVRGRLLFLQLFRFKERVVDNSPAPAAIAVFSDLPQSDSSAPGPSDAPLPKAGLPVPTSLLGMEISPEPQSITVILLQGCFL